jgi:prolyl-tRNA editing enzyme YbaK/EbsC (Cys-tRNA(Pro) deacylase)
MTAKPGGSSARVEAALKQRGYALRVLELPASTRTATDAAAAIGCEVRHIAKSLVFKGRDTNVPILVVASGRNRVDEKKLGRLMAEPVDKADADFVRRCTGFAIGGVPPVGHAQPLKTFIDEDLLNGETIWAAAGTPHAVFALTPPDLIEMTGGQVVVLK